MIADLLAHPQRYEFFQAVRLLLRWLGRQGIGPEGALGDLIRFRNSLALGFPPSEIEAIHLTGEGIPAITITPAMMGLLGTMGALPLHYTERFAAWEQRTRDDGPRAFLDLFSSRQVALFYRAWCKYRVREPLAAGVDRFQPLLLALAGVAPGMGHVPDADADAVALARFAAPLRNRVVSADLIAGVLGVRFGVAVRVEQYTGRWDVLEPDQRTLLARGNCMLGAGATAGARLLRPELGIRIRLGPVSGTEFARFLPGQEGSRALAALLGRFAIDVPYRELQVVLRREAVQGMRLGGSARLGLDGFVCTRSAPGDRDDMCYLLG
ncbi:type VI secretion system protein ImpH [Massilia sp. MP_M2]|uniref:type VI secretion system baseplate subunit TssG n=1 Tax=Massilia sp. MP_M2 TaxID=3071713 RepID=UPI00319E1925